MQRMPALPSNPPSARLRRLGIDTSKRFSFRHVDGLWRQHLRQAYDRKMGRASDGEGQTSFLEAQRRREVPKAQIAELEVQKRAGVLVEVAAMHRLLFERNRTVRDSLLSIPDRVAAQNIQ